MPLVSTVASAAPRRRERNEISEVGLPPRTPDTAQKAADRARQRKAPVSKVFIRSTDDSEPPLAHCLRGGRGGQVRLKLYLSMLWQAGGHPHKVSFPAVWWADLLGLPDPEDNGVRRIHDAIRWLAKTRLIKVESKAGMPSDVTLLEESGNGTEYVHPAKVRRPYVKLPPELWTKGWLATLSAPALAILLILRDQERQKPSDDGIWIAPSIAKKFYSLSPDTWTRGTKELSKQGVIDVERRRFRPSFDVVRVRNFYRLHMDRINSVPGSTQSAGEL